MPYRVARDLRGTKASLPHVALGFRMHSGWGVMVAVDEQYSIVQRQRIELVNDGRSGGRQPYHHARDLGLERAERYLSEYIAFCQRSARVLVKSVVENSERSSCRIVGAGIVLASARALPSLAQILSAHPLIHTAEGNLFRDVIRQSCESSHIPVLGIVERDLKAGAELRLGGSGEKVKRRIEESGKSLGPPWNSDHKCAALAACLALHEFGSC